MFSTQIKKEMKKGNFRTETDSLKVLDIRNSVSKALSKMKKNTVDVFDQCISYELNQMIPTDFEISFDITNHNSNETRIVHLTGLVSAPKKESVN